MDPVLTRLLDAATRPYAGAGWYASNFARGKLRHDPVFFHLLRHGLLPDKGRLYDLGCGQGLLFALINAARQVYRDGFWPSGWLPPPNHVELHGVELRLDRVRAARTALGDSATITQGDIRTTAFAGCSAVVILDVLLYMDDGAQRQLLERIAAALPPGGLLLLREADAAAGAPFYITHWAERIFGAGRGRLWQKLCYRATGEWVALLDEFGFDVGVTPMSEGTPFSNMLFVAKRRAAY